MRLTLKAVNAKLAKRGHQAMLVNGDGYFYFRGGEAADWLDRTVRVPTLSSDARSMARSFPGSEEEERRDSPDGETSRSQIQTAPVARGEDKKRIAISSLTWVSGRVWSPSTMALAFVTASR